MFSSCTTLDNLFKFKSLMSSRLAGCSCEFGPSLISILTLSVTKTKTTSRIVLSPSEMGETKAEAAMEVDLKMVSMVEGIKVEDLNLEDRILPLPVSFPTLIIRYF